MLAALSALCLTSCVAIGAPIAQRDVSQIKPGQTTEADLVQMFGPPTTRSVDIREKKTLDWNESSGIPPQAYLPFIGPCLGGLDVRVQQLSVVVSADGRVERYTMNDSNSERRIESPRPPVLSGK